MASDALVSDCNVIVAGGGRGIGRACSEMLAAHGARVLVADPGATPAGTAVEDEEIASVVAAAIRAAGGVAVGTSAAVGSFADGEAIVSRCVEEFGSVDAVLAPAAVLRDRMIFNMTEDEWRTVLEVNLSGVFGLVRAACVTMRGQRGGRIVTFTSAAGLEGRAGTANYAAAKMGVVGLTKAAALDMAGYGVRVNCIAPRAVTRLTRLVSETRPAAADNSLELETLGDPEDVARLALYLASTRCNANGRVFFCGGGRIGVYGDFVPARTVDVTARVDAAAVAALVERELLG